MAAPFDTSPAGRRHAPAPGILVAVALLATTGAAGHAAHGRSKALIKLIVVVGLFIFVGNSGVFSFGHVALHGDRRLCVRHPDALAGRKKQVAARPAGRS